MFDMDREQILQIGKVTLNVTIAGIRQRQDFVVEREDGPVGKIPYLSCARSLPINEMVRVAEENQLPVKSAGQKIFPRGKGPKDFANI